MSAQATSLDTSDFVEEGEERTIFTSGGTYYLALNTTYLLLYSLLLGGRVIQQQMVVENILKLAKILSYKKLLQPATDDNLLLDNQNSLVALLLHFSSEHLSFNFSTNILLSHLKGLQLNQ